MKTIKKLVDQLGFSRLLMMSFLLILLLKYNGFRAF